MLRLPSGRKMSSFQIIICGFLAVILVGTMILMLPISTVGRQWASFETALFTSVSAVCVTGLVVQDTASFWSAFGQFIIMLLIQIGGLGIISVTAFLVTVSGRKISLLQRSLLMESISADQVGGIVKMTSFIFRLAFTVELIGAILMMPTFCINFGLSGIWMAVFNSVSAFCNAGFDVMGRHTGTFSSLTYFSDSFGVVIPICALIVIGGIGFLTWGDVAFHGIHFKRYRMQSKVILATTAMAQERKITGTISDKDTKEAIMQVTVQLLKTDSTFLKGALSDENGHFSLEAPSNGKFLLKLTSVGYKTLVKNITIEGGKNVALGKIIMGADAIMLKGVTATGQAAKVTVKEDTFVYNAAAYRTPEGSVVEELVKKLPGAQVDDDGKITINGRQVSKIKVDGKEFMTGDTETALKNLPTDIINNIKAYQEKSDLARVTGIDDGEEETVLDFGIKPGMNKGMFTNNDIGIGTHSRYSARLMGALFTDKSRIMLR